MKAIFLYFLQVIIISAILYGYYHFFLRNKKFHGYNRFYLLGTFIVSIAVPFLNIPVYFVKEQVERTSILQTLTAVTSGNFEHEALLSAHTPVASSTFTW